MTGLHRTSAVVKSIYPGEWVTMAKRKDGVSFCVMGRETAIHTQGYTTGSERVLQAAAVLFND